MMGLIAWRGLGWLGGDTGKMPPPNTVAYLGDTTYGADNMTPVEMVFGWFAGEVSELMMTLVRTAKLE